MSYDDATPTVSKEKLFISRIAIIGGGPAGVSLCLQLFNQLKFRAIKYPLEIMVFEKTNTIGAGLPYAEKESSYILNLPKDKMEVIPEDKRRFSTWLITKYPNNASFFSPRYFFGQYLQHRAEKLQEESEKYNIKVNYLTQNSVLNISKLGTDHFSVETNRGTWQANYVILCTGHMPSENYSQHIGQPGYWHNPWDNLAFSTLKNNESVGIIGTRLTAIDIVIRLLNQKHRGPIIMTSRNGLLPAVLAKSIPSYPLQYLKPTAISKTMTLNTLIKLFFKEVSTAQGKQCSFNSIVKSYQDMTALAWLNKEINEAEKGEKPWQQVFFSIYPSFSLIWSKLSLEDKKEFLLKYYSTLMTYLAAFPLDNAYKIQQLLESGQLKVLGGCQSIKRQQEKYILQGKNASFEVKHLFNATGPGHNILCQSLYSKMQNRGLIRQHLLGGLEVDQQTLRVLNSRGQPHPRLFAIGELTRGNYLITADMGCVVKQAAQISKCISQELTSHLRPKPSLGSSKSTFQFFSIHYKKLIESPVISKCCLSLLIMRRGK
ncbi:FAD/NAD(P)-binding protein [Rickettsiella grylli]|nr:FAD/NAD(P)-binding protein [Rickettsiella grylli]